MVVKSATKKKLMDLGIAENFAHTLANDRKWDDVKVLSAQDIAQICETDSETAGTIRDTIEGALKKNRAAGSEATGPTTNVRLKRRVEPAHVHVQRLPQIWMPTMLIVNFDRLMMNLLTTLSTSPFKQRLKNLNQPIQRQNRSRYDACNP